MRKALILITWCACAMMAHAAPSAVEGELLAKLVGAKKAYPKGEGFSLPVTQGPIYTAVATSTGFRIVRHDNVLMAIVTREPLGLRVKLRSGKTRFLERPDAQDTVTLPDPYYPGVSHVIRKADGKLVGYSTRRRVSVGESQEYMRAVREGRSPYE